MKRLRLALRAYPRAVRNDDGDVLLGLAADMVDGGASPTREALGLVRGGLALRAGTLGEAPWGAALDRLGLPLAIAFVAFTVAGATDRLNGSLWPGWFWALAVGGAALATAGLIARRQRLAVSGAGTLAALCLTEAARGNEHWSTYVLYGVHRHPDGLVEVAGVFSLSAVFVCLPGALLLLGAATRAGQRPPARVARTLAWLAAVVLGAKLVASVDLTGWAEVNGVALLMGAFGVSALAALVIGIVRRRRDPAGLLAATVMTLAGCPAALFAGAEQLSDNAVVFYAVLAVAAAAATRTGLTLMRLSARAG